MLKVALRGWTGWGGTILSLGNLSLGIWLLVVGLILACGSTVEQDSGGLGMVISLGGYGSLFGLVLHLRVPNHRNSGAGLIPLSLQKNLRSSMESAGTLPQCHLCCGEGRMQSLTNRGSDPSGWWVVGSR